MHNQEIINGVPIHYIIYSTPLFGEFKLKCSIVLMYIGIIVNCSIGLTYFNSLYTHTLYLYKQSI